ncbi:exonuclease SbcCD subunit D [Periweissella fabalis]|uniref:Nuclease SbcCD subunit D n=1 Tax=Periweissella fabalis TaxID=1070421 RepID=A0A7X6N1D6_9LACO|nr:exonuclease SbcCD subunit D [Periweissella fabalis]MCM0599903.1 exonuclease SbcCD subunit D [Periweissella fabalis]NKZ24041.1 exonuclease SbcCD subunit D [Periweissella fabalis]
MKLLHTADWHIGKQLNQFNLIDVQKDAFQQISTIAKDEAVDGIIIAGDLYDRAIPSVEAVKSFDLMLKQLNLEQNLPIYAISGNHDGANRLNFARDWFGTQQLYLNTKIKEALIPIETPTAQIFLLPYFDPQDARIFYNVSVESNELRTIQQAMERVVTDIIAQFDPQKRHILVTHFNVQGTDNENYELTSETTSTVGGLNTVAASTFAAFDYVALGHLHLWQASPTKQIRYSGSPVKFNTKEAQNKKGVYIVDIPDDGPIKYTFKEIIPNKDLYVLRGTFAELTAPATYEQYPAKGAAFFSIQLLDRPQAKNIRQQLEEIYGDVVELKYHVNSTLVNTSHQQLQERADISDSEIIKQFYAAVMAPDELSQAQSDMIDHILTTLRSESEEQA